MGLEKTVLNFAQRTSSWAKAAGKTSIVQTNPVKPADLKDLRFAPEQNTDTFVKKVESWRDSANHVKPYCKEGETTVEGHHGFHGANDGYNMRFEDRLKEIEEWKNRDFEFYKELYNDAIKAHNRATKRILAKNAEFTKLTPQPRDCVAYRGVSRSIGETRQDFDVINSAKVGDIIVPSRGFAYGAHRKFGTYQYLGSPYDYKGNIAFEPMLIEYRIPKGSQISSNMEHGGEVVFPALSKFKLISKGQREIEKLDGLTGNVIGSYPYKHVVLKYIPEIPL